MLWIACTINQKIYRNKAVIITGRSSKKLTFSLIVPEHEKYKSFIRIIYPPFSLYFIYMNLTFLNLSKCHIDLNLLHSQV